MWSVLKSVLAKKNLYNLSARSGFTLIEAMIAAAILGIIITAMMQFMSFILSQKLSQKTRSKTDRVLESRILPLINGDGTLQFGHAGLDHSAFLDKGGYLWGSTGSEEFVDLTSSETETMDQRCEGQCAYMGYVPKRTNHAQLLETYVRIKSSKTGAAKNYKIFVLSY